MLSILTRSHLLKLNKQLINSTKFNHLLKLNNQHEFNQLKYFKTTNKRGMFSKSRNTNEESTISNLFKSRIVRSSVYAISSSVGFFSLATLWNYEKLFKLQKQRLFPFYQHQTSSKNPICNWWNSLRENQKVFAIILGLNLLVFGAWRIPSLHPLMLKYFTVNLASKHTFLPMFLSIFSHQTIPHIFLNMYCLYSFSNITTYQWGKETMMALYLSAGIFGSMASVILKVYQASTIPSLGASAAILGLVGSTCISNPNLQLSIIFLPVAFSAQNALIGILAFDFTGLLLGWRIMDHAGHLGGTLFGTWLVKQSVKINKNKLI